MCTKVCVKVFIEVRKIDKIGQKLKTRKQEQKMRKKIETTAGVSIHQSIRNMTQRGLVQLKTKKQVKT